MSGRSNPGGIKDACRLCSCLIPRRTRRLSKAAPIGYWLLSSQ